MGGLAAITQTPSPFHTHHQGLPSDYNGLGWMLLRSIRPLARGGVLAQGGGDVNWSGQWPAGLRRHLPSHMSISVSSK